MQLKVMKLTSCCPSLMALDPLAMSSEDDGDEYQNRRRGNGRWAEWIPSREVSNTG